MTRGEILAMAREAGIVDFRDNDHEQQVQQTVDMLMPFADLVAEREREECALLVQTCNTAIADRLAAEIRARGDDD